MPVVWSDLHRLHDPGGEVWVGLRTSGTEVPARVERIRAELAADGARFVEAQRHDDAALLAVHDAALTEYLAGAWREWEAAGLTIDPGQDRVVPYVFAHVGLADAPAIPAAPAARAGYFAYDTMTLVGPGTWDAARAAVDVRADRRRPRAGRRARRLRVLPATGPPRDAQRVRRLVLPQQHGRRGGADAGRPRRPGRRDRRRRPPRQRDARRSSTTAPTCWWARCTSIPVRAGFRTSSASRARPARAPTATSRWRRAPATTSGWPRSRELARWARDARALVVALGVDAAAGDPESPLQVTAAGLRAAGRALGALGVPTVVVQEGGYDLATIGALVREFLTGLEEGAGG